MQRRSFVLAVGGASVSGCLSGGPGEDRPSSESEPSDSDGNESSATPDDEGSADRRYEECPREVISYDDFPTDVQREVDGALEGEYTADRIYLAEAMDVEESYVSVDGTYYDPTVTAGAESVLTLEAVEPKALPRPRPISVEHDRDGERTIALEARADDGTVLVENTRTLHPGGAVEFGETSRVGTHELQIAVRKGDRIETERTDSMRVDESHFETIVVVEPAEIHVTATVADLVPCRYEATD